VIGEVILALTAIVTLCWGIAMHPTSASCPRGWSVEGVRPSGVSHCTPSPPPNCGEPVPPYNMPCPHDDRELPVRIYCTGGSHAIVVDERTIGCTR
jgi:hypothetical protein